MPERLQSSRCAPAAPLLELAPKEKPIAVLMNPSNPPNVVEGASTLNAAQLMGRQARIFGASTAAQIDEAFAIIVEQRFGSLYVSSDPLFFNLRDKLVALAALHALPTIYADREHAEAGGLIGYSANRTDAYRQAGKYAGRILQGDKVGDLPVVLPSKYDLVINLKLNDKLEPLRESFASGPQANAPPASPATRRRGAR